MRNFKIAAVLAASLLGLSQAYAVGVTDTRDASNPGPGATYFVPTDGQKFDSPYYREYDEDWGWTHGSIADTIITANLNISAFDVDFSSGEVDKIFAKDSGSWVELGSLAGNNESWAFSNFVLGANFFDDIATGLEVWMDIDTATNGDWIVTLAKSSLSVNGGGLPPPVPGVPEPETYALMLAGLAAMGAIVRRRRKQK